MQKIIAVSGPTNVGKTSTLNRLAYQLKNNQEYELKYSEISPVETLDQENFRRDNRYIFQHKATSTVIGIATGGDHADVVEESFALFEKENCAICITATRTGGGTVRVVENKQDNYKTDVIYISKVSKRPWEKVDDINVKTAKVLFSILNEWIRGNG